MSERDATMRASDADRERAVERLRVHAAEGRLDIAELEQRIEAALAARTLGDLSALLEDLPAARAPRPRRRRPLRPELRAYLATMALLVAIWALTGMGYFWPVWPLVGWGAFLLGPACGVGARSPRRHGRARPTA